MFIGSRKKLAVCLYSFRCPDGRAFVSSIAKGFEVFVLNLKIISIHSYWIGNGVKRWFWSSDLV